MIANVVDKVLALGRRVTGTAVPATCDVTPATCDVTIDEMGAYLSGDLAGGRRNQFIAHIRNCSECHDKVLVLELSLSLDQAAIMAESPARAAATVAATSPRPRSEPQPREMIPLRAAAASLR
jgi:anti-sigma factor RsiW